MNFSAKTLYNWFLASLPMHLFIAILSVFGNLFIQLDIQVLLLQYLLCIAASIVVFFFQKKINKTIALVIFSCFVLLNFFLSGFSNILEFAERLRPLFIMLLCISAFPVLLLNKEKSAEEKQKTKQNTSKKLKKNQIYLLGFIVVLAFAFRLYNLDYLASYRDEDHHIQAVWQMLNENCFDYKRGLIVTYLGAFFIKITNSISYNDYLYWGRFASTILGTLVCIPLFFIGKKMSYITGIIAAFLWAVSPWAIGVSQNFREHVYYVFLITLMVYLLLQIFDLFFYSGLKQKRKIITNSLLILLILAYGIVLDWFSTLKISGVILALVTGYYLLIQLINQVNLRKKVLKYSPILLLLSALFFVPITQIKFFKLVESPNIKWADTFLSPTALMPVNWWNFKQADIYLVYFLITLGAIFTLLYKNKYWWIYALTFFSLLLGYLYLFDRFYAPRYIIFIYPFFILIIAFSLSASIKLFTNLTKIITKNTIYRSVLNLSFLLVIIQFLQPINTIKAIALPKKLPSQANANTGIVHYNKQVAIDFMRSIPPQIRQNTTIISSIYGESLQHEVDSLGWIEKYQYKDAERFKKVKEIMNNSLNGYLILDKMRNEVWALGYSIKKTNPIKIGNSELSFVKEEALCQIFKWETYIDQTLEKTETDSTLVANQLQIDISKPFTLSFLIKPEDKIDVPILFVGKPTENGIAFTYSPNKESMVINYGVSKNENLVEIPLQMNEWNEVTLFQYSGFKNSTFGVIVNNEEIIYSKIPEHKAGVYDIYTNKLFDGEIHQIGAVGQVDKKRINER